MAIDSAAKRLSILDFDTAPFVAMPAPDGTIASADMLHLLGLYSGIAAASLGPGTAAIANSVASASIANSVAGASIA